MAGRIPKEAARRRSGRLPGEPSFASHDRLRNATGTFDGAISERWDGTVRVEWAQTPDSELIRWLLSRTRWLYLMGSLYRGFPTTLMWLKEWMSERFPSLGSLRPSPEVGR